MAHSKDFNGSPMMPGLDEDAFFDFDSAADSSTVALPIPRIDSFGSNVSTRAYEGGGFNSQLPSVPLDYATHAAASRQTGTINGTTWNIGSSQHKDTKNAIPLTEDELQIIMAMRAMKYKTTQSAISLIPPLANELRYDFPSPEHLGQGVADNFGVLDPFSPGPTVEFSINCSAMEPLWTHETPSIGRGDGSQSNPHGNSQPRSPPRAMTEAQNGQQHQQQQQQLSWRAGEGCPRTGCNSKAKFKSLGALQQHIRNVHDEPLICEIPNCSHKKPFARPTDLRRHVNSAHSDSNHTKYACEIDSCGAQYSRKDHLVKHLREKHGTYRCLHQHCPHATKNRFATEEEAKVHADIDHGDFECAIKACAMAPLSRFTEGSLQLHVQNHHRVSDYFLKDLSWMDQTNVYTLSLEHLGRINPKECKICDNTGYATLE